MSMSELTDVYIYTPESFEYMLLNLGMFKGLLRDELIHTYNYCDTKDYLSWERYYTALLGRLYPKYTKSHIDNEFLRHKNKFKSLVPDLSGEVW